MKLIKALLDARVWLGKLQERDTTPISNSNLDLQPYRGWGLAVCPHTYVPTDSSNLSQLNS